MSAALVGIALRPRQNHIRESQLLNSVDAVDAGMRFLDVSTCMHSRPESNWLDQSASGYAVWRFEITDVPYEARRASFFVKFEDGVVESSFLLYPVESAGGGMVF